MEAALDFDSLIERLRQAFRRDIAAPLRHHHALDTAEDDGAAGDLEPAVRAAQLTVERA